MVVRPLLALALVGMGAAQQCVCDADDVKGYWGPDFLNPRNCTSCNVGGAPLDLSINPAGGTSCTYKDICRDITRPLHERTCYGVGKCVNTNPQSCNCSYLGPTNLAGTFCEKCAPGWIGWPQCTTPACAPAGPGSPTCNNHGTCNDQTGTIACGVKNCADTDLDPTCQPEFYDPSVRTCVGLAGGLSAAIVVGAGETVCGPITCAFGSTCANADPAVARAKCCNKDQVACTARDTSRNPPTVCCHSSQVCCDGVCCPTSQKCSAHVDRAFTVRTEMVNTRWRASGASYVLTPGSPGYSGSWGGGAWTGWKMQDGSVSEPWRMCTTEFLGAVATTRVIILPIVLSVATIISLILVWQAAGLNPVMVAVPAIGIILCSIFLFFSIFWTTAIVISLASLFAIGSGHKGGTAFLVAIAIEVFALAVVCGGLGLGSFFYNSATYSPVFMGLGNPAPSAHSTSWSALASCSSYYDYFFIDPGNVPYDVDPDMKFRDYCSNGWYTYVGIVADVVLALQIFMLAATGVAYLKGGSSGGKSVN